MDKGIKAEKTGANHHGVPQFLQRGWSKDGKTGLTARWHRQDRRYKANAPTKQTFADADMYYPGMEQALSAMESDISRIIRKIVRTGELPPYGHVDDALLRQFLLVQVGRANEELEAGGTYVLKEIFIRAIEAEIDQAEEDEKEDLLEAVGRCTVQIDPRAARSLAIAGHAQATAATARLELVLLRSPSNRVVLPDRGAWFENALANKLQVNAGWGHPGAIGVLPVDKSYCLIWWDRLTYRWRGTSKGFRYRDMSPVEEDMLGQTALSKAKSQVVLYDQPTQKEWVARQEEAAASNSRQGMCAKGTGIPGLLFNN